MNEVVIARRPRRWHSLMAIVGTTALVVVPTVAHAHDPSTEHHQTAIISPDRAQHGQAMNYAIVLDQASSQADQAALLDFVTRSGDAVLVDYPHLGVFFAQSAHRSFATRLGAYATQQRITVHSIGPTRGHVVTGEELIIDPTIITQAPGENANQPTHTPDAATPRAEGPSDSPSAPATDPTQPSVHTSSANMPSGAPDATPETHTVHDGTNTTTNTDIRDSAGQNSTGSTESSAAENANSSTDASSPSKTSAPGESGASSIDTPEVEDEFAPDPRTADAWGLAAVGATEAAKVNVPRAPVLVGVIDTGIDPDHQDLVGQIREDKSVSCSHNGIPRTRRDAWADNHRHGTHVAGTIAAAHNGIGVDSVAPGAQLAAVQAANAEGSFYPEYVTCAFNWAVKQGFDITNNSYYVDPWLYWEPTDPTQAAGYEAVRRAVTYAEQAGIINVVAAGNSRQDLDELSTDSHSPNDAPGEQVLNRDVRSAIKLPAMLPDVITVSALRPTRASDNTAAEFTFAESFSNFGARYVTVSAPGQGIISTVPPKYRNYGYEYGTLSGTSMAAPHAAGVLALLKSVHPEASPARLIELLKKHAAETKPRLVPLHPAFTGVGMVNALSAVLRDQPTPQIGQVEYSMDGTQWQPLPESIDVRTTPTAFFRAGARGPVTSVELRVADTVVGAATHDDLWGGDLSAASTAVNLAALYGENTSAVAFPVSVRAFGRNLDPRADDDVTEDRSLTLTRSATEERAENPGNSDTAEDQPETPTTALPEAPVPPVTPDQPSAPSQPLPVQPEGATAPVVPAQPQAESKPAASAQPSAPVAEAPRASTPDHGTTAGSTGSETESKPKDKAQGGGVITPPAVVIEPLPVPPFAPVVPAPAVPARESAAALESAAVPEESTASEVSLAEEPEDTVHSGNTAQRDNTVEQDDTAHSETAPPTSNDPQFGSAAQDDTNDVKGRTRATQAEKEQSNAQSGSAQSGSGQPNATPTGENSTTAPTSGRGLAATGASSSVAVAIGLLMGLLGIGLSRPRKGQPIGHDS